MKMDNKKIKYNQDKISSLRDFQKTFIDELAKNKNSQKVYLQNALQDYHQDKNLGAFLLALRTIAAANGGVNEISKKAKMNRQTVYKALSNEGNPTFLTMDAILNSLGLQFEIKKIHNFV